MGHVVVVMLNFEFITLKCIVSYYHTVILSFKPPPVVCCLFSRLSAVLCFKRVLFGQTLTPLLDLVLKDFIHDKALFIQSRKRIKLLT